MKSVQENCPVRKWLTKPLAPDVAASIERLSRVEDARYLAIMPDVHLASEVCVGVALATERLIYPRAVGSDIGCGMAAIRFAVETSWLCDEKRAAQVLARMYQRIPALKHVRETLPAEPSTCLMQVTLSDPRLNKLKDRDGRWQLGTLGRGNHFVELQADEHDRLWLMVHSGSRGMGQAITAHHLRQAGRARHRTELLGLDSQLHAGQAYLHDVGWAIRYAEQNRMAMIAAVETLLADLLNVRADPESLIHCNHNHVRRETHGGQEVWVHRKGALSARDAEPGVIPGSMGSASFHVIGRGEAAALCSSSHGAGRELSRREAFQKIQTRRLEREMHGVWFDHRQAARLCDEAPSAYREIHSVMRAQRDLTKIVRQLRPLLSYKGV